MSHIKTTHVQECDFCHREISVTSDGLYRISLPGYNTDREGGRYPGIITGSICLDCLERLREYIAKALRVESMDYSEEHIAWKDDEMIQLPKTRG